MTYEEALGQAARLLDERVTERARGLDPDSPYNELSYEEMGEDYDQMLQHVVISVASILNDNPDILRGLNLDS